MSLFDRIKQRKKTIFQNDMPLEQNAKNEKNQAPHPLHEEGASFRYVYSTLGAMAADVDMPINGMEIRLLARLMESINLDGGMREVLLHSNNQEEHILQSLSVTITDDYQKDILYADMIIMCLADSNEFSQKEERFIEKMEKLLDLPALHTESLKKYIQMRIKHQTIEAETLMVELPRIKGFVQGNNQYLSSMVSMINESIKEATSGIDDKQNRYDQHGQGDNSNRPKSNKMLGIDFGTTYCCMAMIENGKPKTISTQEGYYRTSSIVAFNNDGTYIVGDAAKKTALIDPARCITSIKRQLLNEKAFKIGNKQYSP